MMQCRACKRSVYGPNRVFAGRQAAQPGLHQRPEAEIAPLSRRETSTRDKKKAVLFRNFRFPAFATSVYVRMITQAASGGG